MSTARQRFLSDFQTRLGMAGILLLLLPAVFAPLLVNGRPLLACDLSGHWSLPFARFLFAPDSSEKVVEQLFNYSMLFLPLWLLLRRHGKLLLLAAVLLLLPFVLTKSRLDKTDYRQQNYRWAVFAPIPYGPYEIVGTPYAKPGAGHYLGLDNVGRDVSSRMIYGARSSLAVGLIATAIALVIGTVVGMLIGFYRGVYDLVAMRIIEILLCFPTFLLLLILMSMLRDYKFEQSILIVIAIIGLTGWIGLAILVRGEVLKQRPLGYIQSCLVTGLPTRRILFFHLLPNITGPILISFTFGVAGSIMAESSLSFLGFGVQPPTPSWGALLSQAFDNPLSYWHLMFFPGLALFVAVLSFNITGEGLRKALIVR